MVGGDEIQIAALGAIPIRVLQGLVAIGVIIGDASDCFREFDEVDGCKYDYLYWKETGLAGFGGQAACYWMRGREHKEGNPYF